MIVSVCCLGHRVCTVSHSRDGSQYVCVRELRTEPGSWQELSEVLIIVMISLHQVLG